MAGTSYKGSEIKSVDQFIKDKAGLASSREKEIGQHIGYRYDVNLLPDYSQAHAIPHAYMEFMGWDDLNWLEDVHMGYEEGLPAIFDRNVNGWVRIPQECEAARQSAGPRHAGARAADPVPDVAEAPDGGARQGVQEVLAAVLIGRDAPARRMRPVRGQGHNADPGRQVRVEQVIVPIGGLIKVGVRGLLGNGTGHTVRLSIFVELENAIALLQQTSGNRRLRAKERSHDVAEVTRLLEIAGEKI